MKMIWKHVELWWPVALTIGILFTPLWPLSIAAMVLVVLVWLYLKVKL